MDVHPFKMVLIGIDPYPFHGKPQSKIDDLGLPGYPYFGKPPYGAGSQGLSKSFK
jgi:hypothetical protein